MIFKRVPKHLKLFLPVTTALLGIAGVGEFQPMGFCHFTKAFQVQFFLQANGELKDGFAIHPLLIIKIQPPPGNNHGGGSWATVQAKEKKWEKPQESAQ